MPPVGFVVTTGAESSGKTTLARDLSEALGAILVDEASRPYLEAKPAGTRYQREDLLAIARQQAALEQQALEHSPSSLVVCDTDLLVILVWHEIRFGPSPPDLLSLFARQRALAPRHYLLCDWQIPWQPDPLRENPHDRDALFATYRETLSAFDLPFTLVSGSPEARLNSALSASQRLQPASS